MTNILNQFATIFGETTGMVTIFFLISGLLSFIIELFVPGIGIFAAIGLILSIIGISYRIICGLTLTQSLLLIIFYIILVCICYALFITSMKKGIISHSKLFLDEQSIPSNFESLDKKALIGMLGITTTSCKPIGKAVFGENKVEYEVLSDDSYIDKDTSVKVIEVTDDNVVVKKV